MSARLRHIAVVVRDLEKAAKFYEGVFGLQRVGDETLDFASAIYLTDGVINLALLNYKGERGSGLKRLDDRHKRELRRHRVDELKMGLATVAGSYRDALVAGRVHRPEVAIAAVHDLHDAIETLERNPNEQLLLQALLLRLPPLEH